VSERALIAQVDERSCPGASAQEKTRGALALLGGLQSLVQPGDRVLLKPNFVAPFADAATSLEVIAAVVEAVRDCGGAPFIAESAGFEFDTETTFALLGAREWAQARGVPLLNLDGGPFARVATELGTLEIAQAALEADVLINLPKLKGHSLTRVTLGIKNLMGLLNRDSRRWLHARGLERGLAALAQVIKPQLTILDALTVTSRAAYAESAPLGMILGSRDLVALDHYACALLGEDPQQIGHIRGAIQRGLGASEYRVIGGSAALDGESPSREWHSQPKDESYQFQSGIFNSRPYASDDHPSAHAPRFALYRLFFRAMYLADLPFSRLTGRSLIPPVHYWLGIRPHLERELCDRCGRCAEVCPVGAIKVAEKRIMPAKCMRVRCLRCLSACPRRAIRTRGWSAGAR
jgi:uncharacterized protein (DUF362 family)/NAD-dependent dihydropyrimidine dehydrogenase PreA subunit